MYYLSQPSLDNMDLAPSHYANDDMMMFITGRSAICREISHCVFGAHGSRLLCVL